MPKLSVKDIDHGWRELVALMDDLKKKGLVVKAGIIGSAAEQMHDKLPLVELAMIQEFGAPSVNIPARSFIRAPFERNRSKYIEALRTLMRKVYERKMAIEQALGIIGLMMSNDMKREGPGTPPPNKPSTIRAKGSDVTLVDRGKMIGALSWSVEQRSEGAA